MVKNLVRQLEEIRRRHELRVRRDGSSSSGNWGHIGRPGIQGGSQSGGGGAFRLETTRQRNHEKVSVYTSQAKIRTDMNTKMKKAKASGNMKRFAKLEARASKINMNQKTAKQGLAGSVRNIDLDASRNILQDTKGRGRMAWETSTGKVKGTREAVQNTFPNRQTKYGSVGSKSKK